MVNQKNSDISFKQRCLNYSHETTLHAVGRVTDVRRKLIQRTIWFVLFLIALVAYFFYFATAIIYYYRYPVSTSVEYKLESSLDFPSVTICNYNIIRKSFIDSFNDSTGQLVLDIINPYDKANVDYSSDDFEDEIYDASEYIDMREFGEKGKHHREDMFMGCDFMSANYSYDPCQFNDELLVTKVTQMGYCYTFHPQSYIEKYGALVSTRPGQAGGLHLQIDLRQDEYTSGAEGSAAGMRILVHDPKVEPLMRDLGVSIHPGTQTNIVITKMQVVNMPPPYEGSTCIDTNPKRNASFQNPLKYFKDYSYSSCRQECLIQHNMNDCGCVGFFMATDNAPVCDLYTMMFCQLESFEKYYYNSAIEQACNCLHPCEETTYSVTQSMAYFPNDYTIPSIVKSYEVSEDYVRKNDLTLNIYFGELGYTKIIQRPDYPPTSLFAEVGGLCGLFLGASILTLAELLEFIISASIGLLHRGDTKVEEIKIRAAPLTTF